MTRLILAAGVAALAITAPAAAGPHGGGGGHGNGGGPPAAKQHGGGGGGGPKEFKAPKEPKAPKAFGGSFGPMRGGEMRAPKHGGQRDAMKAMKAQSRGAERAAMKAQARQNHEAEKFAKQAQKARAQERANIRTAEKIRAKENKQALREIARRNEVLGRNNAPVMAVRQNQTIPLGVRGTEGVNFAQNLGYGIGGCPPGLAKKPVACMPPGQAKQLIGAPLATAARIAALNELPVRLQSLYSPTPDYYYRYGDGYLYQVNRSNDVISSLLPLFGLGYTVGEPFPSAYPYYGMPAAYQPFYPSSPYYDYRYADGYMYQVDPYTGLIENVDPLLGYGYGYGQPMPLAYSAYNVPYQYRPYYYDTSDYYYRYAPGAIYQVDPTTSLITAVAALLSPNSLAIGQPLPVGYSAYNVPYAYRSTYYDTPDAWYRYSNGSIYRVDPVTQLVTALVASALT